MVSRMKPFEHKIFRKHIHMDIKMQNFENVSGLTVKMRTFKHVLDNVLIPNPKPYPAPLNKELHGSSWRT